MSGKTAGRENSWECAIVGAINDSDTLTDTKATQCMCDLQLNRYINTHTHPLSWIERVHTALDIELPC